MEWEGERSAQYLDQPDRHGRRVWRMIGQSKSKESVHDTWRSMNEQSRRAFIQAVAPFTPNSPSEPVLIINGKRHDVHGACILTPHLCVSSLVPGDNLIQLIDSIVSGRWGKPPWLFLPKEFGAWILNGKVPASTDKIRYINDYSRTSSPPNITGMVSIRDNYQHLSLEFFAIISKWLMESSAA